ncbi:hypothetical protein [Bradyrhizobium prioriisuperbiae]|uniref:hypothetical protein n=1 Tax=Bradyrhizobium prioriisuperbiae TaxID=2854389 RepID=UPI0028EF8EAD|nr:hypothetical protein [Bradyrhizobium prioritasuperba]
MAKKPKLRTTTPFIGQIFEKIAPKIGAKVLIEPDWRIAGQITFKNGRRCYFRHNTIDINSLGASDIAKDKDYANFFMAQMGYSVVPGRAFFSEKWCEAIRSRLNIDAAYRYAVKIGFPVVVKPNSGSQGKNVYKVYTKREFYRSLRAIFKEDRVALVQPAVTGNDYRVVVLDDKIISAYQRVPLNVTGDGSKTIRQLLRVKQRSFVASSRDTRLRPQDPRIKDYLKRQHLTFASVPRRGDTITLLANANLSSGGDSIDVTKKIHPDFAKLTIRLTKDMGLRLCGVDLMINGSIAERPDKFWILEINSAPGLDHYARSGRSQQTIVEALYLKVLQSMGQRRS